MKKDVEISEEKYLQLLDEFYSYFKDGYAFEDFLKVYLEKIGLDEVCVTQRSRDGGIDLKAKRSGIGDFSSTDEVNYFIQAKRNSPNSSISVKKIRELKGTIPFGHKGIFITTAYFSKDAIKESDNDLSKPVILIDGRMLLNSCIEHEIGFVFTPIFSKYAMDKLMQKEKNINNSLNETFDTSNYEIVVEKKISSNDIRARIIPIPKIILEKIPSEMTSYNVTINNEFTKELTINRGRNYFAGVTEIFKKYKLKDEDGTFNPTKTTWCWNDDKISIFINRGD